MSIVKGNPLLAGVSGRIGNVVLRTVRGQLQMIARPGVRQKPPSRQQKIVRKKFLEAVQYAKKQIAEPGSRTLYESGITETKHSAYLVAISDFLHAPEVRAIDAARYKGTVGDRIAVKATDDFGVTSLKVIILDSAGAQLEEGEAVPDPAKINTWNYRVTAANNSLPGTTIRAVAYDRPGNVGEMSKVL